MESADFADVLLWALRTPEKMTATDSLRYDRYLNLKLNLREAIYTNALHGTMEGDLAAGWLDDLRNLLCDPGMTDYWAQNKSGYHPKFQLAVDSGSAGADCRK
jgi:hypothetical protein